MSEDKEKFEALKKRAENVNVQIIQAGVHREAAAEKVKAFLVKYNLPLDSTKEQVEEFIAKQEQTNKELINNFEADIVSAETILNKHKS